MRARRHSTSTKAAPDPRQAHHSGSSYQIRLMASKRDSIRQVFEIGSVRMGSDREALDTVMADVRRHLEAFVERAADSEARDTDHTWRPGDDLVVQRDAILNYGGRPPYEAKRVMKLLGVETRQALFDRRLKGKLLALPMGERKLLYPHWQFAGTNGELVPGLSDVLKKAPRGDPWGVADILTSPQRTLGGETPIAVLAREKEPEAKRKVLSLLRRAYE